MYNPMLVESIVPLSTDIIPWVVPGKYLISNYGKVLDRYDRFSGLRNEIPITPNNTVLLLSVNGGYKEVKLDKLVYTHFVAPVSMNHKLVHVDNNIYNNRVSNLQMVHERFDDNHRVQKIINRAQGINRIVENNPLAVIPDYDPNPRFLQNIEISANFSNADKSMADLARNPNNMRRLYYLTGEEWRPINWDPEIYPTWYEVSNYGHIFSNISLKQIKLTIINTGYYRVQMIGTDGIKKDRLIHRLVAFAFVPNDDPINKTTVHHIDGNRANNRADNLGWISLPENSKIHIKEREEFDKESVIKVCEALQAGMGYEDICRDVLHCKYDSNIHKKIYKIHKRNSFTDISMNYTF